VTPLRRILLRDTVALLAVLMIMVLLGSPVEAATREASEISLEPADRWVGSVCGAVSSWLKARKDVETRMSGTLGDLTAGDVRAKTAKTRLTRAIEHGVDATSRFTKSVKAAGTPSVTGGKQLTSAYLKTLAEYGDAYKESRAALDRAQTRSAQQLAAAAQLANGNLAADLAEICTDPVEELRAAPELTTAINGACGDVATYLVAKLDPPCRALLDTAQGLPDLTTQFLAAAPGSPQETSRFDDMSSAVFGQLRNQLEACNVAGLPGACRTVFQTTQRLAEVWNQVGASEEGSPREQTEKDELARQADALRTQLQTVCR
jgi:hypothetical protein